MNIFLRNRQIQDQIAIVGVGGAGGKVVNKLIVDGPDEIFFIAVDTDFCALEALNANLHIPIGERITEGRGSGANPQMGRDAAEESHNEIRTVMQYSPMVVIVAGLGGGTGTGAAPFIAGICQELGVPLVAVVSTPFSFEGKKRRCQAEESLECLHRIADAVINVSNDHLGEIAAKISTIQDRLLESDAAIIRAIKNQIKRAKTQWRVSREIVQLNLIIAGLSPLDNSNPSENDLEVMATEKAISNNV